jgi:hypothetical protein
LDTRLEEHRKAAAKALGRSVVANPQVRGSTAAAILIGVVSAQYEECGMTVENSPGFKRRTVGCSLWHLASLLETGETIPCAGSCI